MKSIPRQQHAAPACPNALPGCAVTNVADVSARVAGSCRDRIDRRCEACFNADLVQCRVDPYRIFGHIAGRCDSAGEQAKRQAAQGRGGARAVNDNRSHECVLLSQDPKWHAVMPRFSIVSYNATEFPRYSLE